MPSEYRKGYVYIQNQYAGVVAETEEGYTFSYDNEYRNKENAVAVSLTLPLSEKSYSASLVPEGWLLDVASRNWKINANDRFGLLLLTCRDCIGDVSIRTEKG